MLCQYIRKGIFRFRQLGGWRLLRTYAKAGVLPTLLNELAKTIIQRRPLKEAYPAVTRKIVPLLQTQYRPLVNHLTEISDAGQEHEKNEVVWFCW
jgi:hypothetical protein